MGVPIAHVWVSPITHVYVWVSPITHVWATGHSYYSCSHVWAHLFCWRPGGCSIISCITIRKVVPPSKRAVKRAWPLALKYTPPTKSKNQQSTCQENSRNHSHSVCRAIVHRAVVCGHGQSTTVFILIITEEGEMNE